VQIQKIVDSAVFALLFALLPIELPEMPVWIAYTLSAFAVFIILISNTPLWERFFKKKSKPTTSCDIKNKNKYDSVVKIIQEIPSNRFPLAGDLIGSSFSIIALIIGIRSIILWATGQILGPNGYEEWILFFLLVPFPIWVLVNTWVLERRQYKKGKSRVEKHEILVMNGQANNIYNACINALNVMQASIRAMERPKQIKALCRNSIINIELTYQNEKKTEIQIFISSDSKWMTTEIDFGINQKNVDTLECLIRNS
jgi:hypothetical protein